MTYCVIGHTEWCIVVSYGVTDQIIGKAHRLKNNTLILPVLDCVVESLSLSLSFQSPLHPDQEDRPKDVHKYQHHPFTLHSHVLHHRESVTDQSPLHHGDHPVVPVGLLAPGPIHSKQKRSIHISGSPWFGKCDATIQLHGGPSFQFD